MPPELQVHLRALPPSCQPNSAPSYTVPVMLSLIASTGQHCVLAEGGCCGLAWPATCVCPRDTDSRWPCSSTETLDAENKFFCDACQCLQEAQKRMKVGQRHAVLWVPLALPDHISWAPELMSLLVSRVRITIQHFFL